MNDADLKDYGVLAVSEPYAKKIDGKVVTSPTGHSNWTRMIPTHTHDAPWPIRSMLWVRSDIEAEQVPIPSADLTAAVLQYSSEALRRLVTQGGLLIVSGFSGLEMPEVIDALALREVRRAIDEPWAAAVLQA